MTGITPSFSHAGVQEKKIPDKPGFQYHLEVCYQLSITLRVTTLPACSRRTKYMPRGRPLMSNR